jgi:hypothetical protein
VKQTSLIRDLVSVSDPRVLNEKEAGLRYIMYSGMNSRGSEGSLFKWKQRCLFEPLYFIYDEMGDWRSMEMRAGNEQLPDSARPPS